MRPRNYDAYEYQALTEPGTIRLLRFGHCDLDQLPSISISLEIVKIEEAPAYHALSYCWGKKKAKTQIMCDSKVIRVTPTLLEALEHLYLRMNAAKNSSIAYRGLETALEHEPSEGSHTPEDPSPYLWIDQLCINQASTQEKNHQVALMGRIYRGAVRTLIWLGPDGNFAGEAFDLIHQVFAVVEREHPRHKEILVFDHEVLNEALHVERGMPPRDSEQWLSLWKLLTRPWFERLWVFQEVVLSARDASIVCGQEDCSWYVLATACSWLISHGYLAKEYCPVPTINLRQIRYTSMSNADMDLSGLLFLTAEGFHATDPRDKLFGLLGLARQDSLEALVADYTLSAMQAYRNFAWHMICQQGRLALLNMPLCCNKHIKDPFRCTGRQTWWKGTPSWAPNLEVPVQFTPNTSIKTTPSGELGWQAHFKASGDIPAQLHNFTGPSRRAELSTLSLVGLEVDKLRGCFEVNDIRGMRWQSEQWQKRTRYATPDWSDWRAVIFSFYRYRCAMRRPIAIRLWFKVLQFCPGSGILPLARSMCKAMAIDASTNWESLGESDFKDFCACMVDLYTMCSAKFSSTHTRFHTSFDLLRRHGEGGVGSHYQTSMENQCHMKRCFITTNGRIGVGSTSMKKGDSIVVLFGAGTPYILRRRKMQWLLIGDCYVDGLMDGQSIDRWRAGELQKQRFEII